MLENMLQTHNMGKIIINIALVCTPFCRFCSGILHFCGGLDSQEVGLCVCVCLCVLVCKVIFEYQVILCGLGPNHYTHGTALKVFVSVIEQRACGLRVMY
jgi:hypothetical protein